MGANNFYPVTLTFEFGLLFENFNLLFSSPELKAQVPQNHWANFNQTCHKASLSEGDSVLFKWRALLSSKGGGGGGGKNKKKKKK